MCVCVYVQTKPNLRSFPELLELAIAHIEFDQIFEMKSHRETLSWVHLPM